MIKGSVDNAYGRVEAHKACRTWADRQKDFKFFTPGLLYWKLMVDRDLVETFVEIQSVPKALRPKKYVADSPIFAIDPPVSIIKTPKGEMPFDISRTIYICPLETWPALDDFIMSSGFIERKSQLFAQAMKQPDIEIPDFGAIKNGYPATDPILAAVYGIYTNSFCSIWLEKRSTIYTPPKAKLLSPSDLTIEDGKMFYRELE